MQDLNTLIERYLEPLKAETFLSSDDVDQLFGNMQEIIQFQRLFQQSIEEAVELDDGRSVVRENIVVRVCTLSHCPHTCRPSSCVTVSSQCDLK